MSPHYFGDMLTRMEKQHGGGSGEALSYFSSHPSTKERTGRTPKQAD